MKKATAVAFGLLSVVCLSQTSRADHFYFNGGLSEPGITIPVGGQLSIGASVWTNAANPLGTIAMPGNTYELIPDGNAIGTPNTGNGIETIVRAYGATNTNSNEIVDWKSGPKFIFIGSYFPGDSLQINTNTEMRLKSPGFDVLNFPGVNGNPGLVLNGGMLDCGSRSDQGGWPLGTISHIITGLIELVPGSSSYVSTTDFEATNLDRNMQIDGQLIGTGSLVLVQGGNTYTNLLITGSNSTFGGTFYDRAGWLVFAGTNNNSFGMNSSVVVDTEFDVPVPPFDPHIYSNNELLNGPARVEFGYDVNTSGGLVLVHGGQLLLHQTCFFSSVTIEGLSLDPGTYTYAELAANFTNFVAGGSGSITVRPFQVGSAGSSRITNIAMSGATLNLSGNGGHFGNSFRLLTSTTLKSGSWSPVSTNVFGINGVFNLPAPFNAGDKQRFYSIVSP